MTIGNAIGGHVATKADMADLRPEMAALKGEVTLVKWMLGVNVACSLALLLKTFFTS